MKFSLDNVKECEEMEETQNVQEDSSQRCAGDKSRISSPLLATPSRYRVVPLLSTSSLSEQYHLMVPILVPRIGTDHGTEIAAWYRFLLSLPSTIARLYQLASFETVAVDESFWEGVLRVGGAGNLGGAGWTRDPEGDDTKEIMDSTVGLPALEISAAFPQATPATIFPAMVSDYYQFDDLLNFEERSLQKKVREVMEKEVAPIMAGVVFHT
ncbi:hypothetical protein KFK09_007335 [Dendrobium nobile]|uniref:Uncharacterized protein n=1 Tax=Dendrobium nobile TaxID=94219 RepID=A0A8T3BWT1_DENNO|nr:hypothetical protein KFK09_007335 [Dendrobium nobile]